MMKTIAYRFMSLAAAFIVVFTFSIRAEAGLVISLAPTPSTDLSNVHVGDFLYFVTRGGTDVAAGIDEHLVSFPGVHLFADQDMFDVFEFVSGFGAAGNNLHSEPNLMLWRVQPNAAGTVTLYNGFSDCNGLPNNTSGCAITNLGATRPADSNRITFTVHDVPEPSTLAIMCVGLFALGYCRRPKAKQAF